MTCACLGSSVQTKNTYVVKELNPTFFEDYESKE